MLIPYPYTDLSGTKKRPVVILTEADTFGNHIVAKITSVLRPDLFAFPIENQNVSVVFQKPSEVRVNELFTVNNTLVIKIISMLNSTTTRLLLDKVMLNFQ